MEYVNLESSITLTVNGTKNGTAYMLSAADHITSQICQILLPLILICAVFVNVLYLIAFCQEKRLRTKFNYYLINAVVANLLYSTSIPNVIATNFYGYWPLGKYYCTFNLWVDWSIHPVTLAADMLIGVNRVWGLCWPFHYRKHNSKKLTFRIIMASWIWAQLVIVPGIIANHFNLDDDTRQCDVMMKDHKTIQIWATFDGCVNYFLPESLMLASFGIIMFRIRQQNRERKLLIVAVISNNRSPRSSADSGSSASSDQGLTTMEQAEVLKACPSDGAATRERRLSLMFLYLTISFMTCVSPPTLFWFIYSIDNSIYSLTVSLIVYMLNIANCAVTPVTYQTGSRELRDKLMQILTCGKCGKPPKKPNVHQAISVGNQNAVQAA